MNIARFSTTLLSLGRGSKSVSKLVIRQAHFYGTSTNEPFEDILYEVRDKVAFITLNRPEHLNAISARMPLEIEGAVTKANQDDDVKVIVLAGNGRAFCAGYDLKAWAENERGGENVASQKMPWDPFTDYRLVNYCNQSFMSLWHSYKPTIAKIHGYGIAGGSDMALCSDMVIMAEDAKIGYPPTRVWGCPTTAMWTFRVGPERAKRILLTGDLIDGKEAARIGLITEAVPAAELDEAVQKLADRIKTVPANQLFFQKQVINQVMEQMGLAPSQRLAALFDGMTRHSPEGIAFQQYSMKHGFKKAVKLRDSGEMDWTKEAENLEKK